MPSWEEYKTHAKERGALALELFAVRSTPNGNMELLKEILPEHLVYQKQLEEQGHLVLAGPLSDESGVQMQAVGMIIYRASNLEQAKKLADNDPMHKKGARTYEIRKWLINEGSLSFKLSLSSQTVSFL